VLFTHFTPVLEEKTKFHVEDSTKEMGDERGMYKYCYKTVTGRLTVIVNLPVTWSGTVV
jgi:hypothetical protein